MYIFVVALNCMAPYHNPDMAMQMNSSCQLGTHQKTHRNHDYFPSNAQYTFSYFICNVGMQMQIS